MEIADIIRQMVKDESVEIYSSVAVVKSVDVDKRIADCELVHSGNTMFDCRLSAEIESTKGIVIIPKKDSFVVLTFIDKNHAFISLTSEIEQVLIDVPLIEGVVDEIKIKDTKITLNDGNNFGVPKSQETADKIKAVETKVNDILTVLNGITITLAPSGTIPFSGFFSAITSIAPTTTRQDIENSDFKH